MREKNPEHNTWCRFMTEERVEGYRGRISVLDENNDGKCITVPSKTDMPQVRYYLVKGGGTGDKIIFGWKC